MDFIEYSLCKPVKPLHKFAITAKESFSVRLSSLTMQLQKKKNGSNHLAALCEYRRLKDLRKSPLSRIGLRKMIMKFEGIGNLYVLPGRGRKSVETEIVEEVAIAVVERPSSSIYSSAISVKRVGDSVVDSTKSSAIHLEMVPV
ncbi:uncharacterized protein TNCV_2964581 [Trichonephila clavipes]|nr:uncharacterized protein TNCV_2964581 [Trichonephila clavipes]